MFAMQKFAIDTLFALIRVGTNALLAGSIARRALTNNAIRICRTSAFCHTLSVEIIWLLKTI